MAKVYSCSDGGMDCEWAARAATWDELWQIITGHFHSHHNMSEMPQDMRAKVESAIHDE